MSAVSMVDAAADRDYEHGAGVRGTEAGGGKESAQFVRSPEHVNGGALETLAPEESFKEHSTGSSENPSGGAKGAASSDCQTMFNAIVDKSRG
jgi:hypothetical protein